MKQDYIKQYMCCFWQPLKVNMPSETVGEIDSILSSNNADNDQLHGIFSAARNYIQTEISEHLSDFRSKRSLGKFCGCCAYVEIINSLLPWRWQSYACLAIFIYKPLPWRLDKCACSKVKTLIISDHNLLRSTATQYRCWPTHIHRLSIRKNLALQCWHSTCINMHTHIWWWRSEGQRSCVSACIKRPGRLWEIIE